MNITTKSFIENIKINENNYKYISLEKISNYFEFDILKSSFSYRMLVENLVRCSDQKVFIER